MRRRGLLATLATGAVGSIAGCGYAYGGGDVRDEASIYAGGFGAVHWVLDDDRIAAANSGRHFGHEREGFHEGTSVTVADLDGNELWRHTHWEQSVDAAGVDPVYLLDEQGQVVALAAAGLEEDDQSVNRGTADGEELWRVAVEGAQERLVGGDRGAYVAVGEGVAAVRDGEEAWRVSLPGSVESLHVAGDTLLAATAGAVVALSASGRERWRRTTAGVPSIASGGGRVAIHDGRVLTVTEAETDEGAWSADDVGRDARPTVTEDRVYVVDRDGLRTFDATTGERPWRADVPVVPASPVVPAPEGAYAVGGRCLAVALDEEGTRWTRELSVRDCEIVGGWLDGERVAFLFETGELRWLQRTDQDRGLL